MKGYKTIIFNAVMLAAGMAGIFGVDIPPELAEQVATAFVLLQSVGNAVFRAVTTSPIFKKGDAGHSTLGSKPGVVDLGG